jgi:hypothetical protein
MLMSGLLFGAEKEWWPPQPVTPANPNPLPSRIVASDLVVHGRVVEFEPKEIKAPLHAGSRYSFDYQIAVVKISEVISGRKETKEARVGFVPPTADNRSILNSSPTLINPALSPIKLGQEGLFFLRKHDLKDFLIGAAMWGGSSIASDSADFEKSLELSRQLAKVLDRPAEALKNENPANRYLAAAMLISRYRTWHLSSNQVQDKRIDSEVSELLLQVLAEANWDNHTEVQRPTLYPPHPYHVFSSLGVTKADGYDPPNDPAELAAKLKYTQNWLRENQAKFRIQRLESPPN